MAETFQTLPIGTIGKNSTDEVRVSLSEYKGQTLCDIRVYSAFTTAKIPMATKKGVAVRVASLPELVRVIVQAEAKARELGLLSDAPAVGGDA